MSTTPISDYIAQLVDSSSSALFAAFKEELLASRIGLVAAGLPQGADHGEALLVSAKADICLDIVEDEQGRPLIKVLADPVEFERVHQAGINATLQGSEVLEIACKSSEVEGVLVCSATSFHSCPIYCDE